MLQTENNTTLEVYNGDIGCGWLRLRSLSVIPVHVSHTSACQSYQCMSIIPVHVNHTSACSLVCTHKRHLYMLPIMALTTITLPSRCCHHYHITTLQTPGM